MSEQKPHLFKPGQSGNPSGRPKVPPEVREMARALTQEAIEGLAGIARSSENDSARVSAWNSILDRAWGKPAQAVTGEGGEGPIEHDMSIRVIFGRRDDGA